MSRSRSNEDLGIRIDKHRGVGLCRGIGLVCQAQGSSLGRNAAIIQAGPRRTDYQTNLRLPIDPDADRSVAVCTGSSELREQVLLQVVRVQFLPRSRLIGRVRRCSRYHNMTCSLPRLPSHLKSAALRSRSSLSMDCG